jgi:hypothetical protein
MYCPGATRNDQIFLHIITIEFVTGDLQLGHEMSAAAKFG